MLESYDSKFGEIAKTKQIIILDLSKGAVSYETLKKISFKKLFDKSNKINVKEYESKNKKDKQALKDGFWV